MVLGRRSSATELNTLIADTPQTSFSDLRT
jgi:hypothetical protein